MVMLLVNAYLQNEGDLGYSYISNSVSYVHASWVLGCLHPVEWFEYFVFNGLGYLYPVVWFEYFVFNGYDVFVASWGDDLLLLVMVPCPYRSCV
jgi:hypothetical protein